MNVIKARDYDDLSRKAATIISAQIIKKPTSVLGLATGSSPVGTYKELIRLNKEGVIDFGGVTTVNLDEYYNTPITDPNSYYYFMFDNLFNHININKSSVNLPDGQSGDSEKSCQEYERLIEGLGGIDLQLLGIGRNGHIAFNEPAEEFSPITHHVRLTDSTIDANARFYKSRDEVPTSAITMGIGTIMKAKSILLIANGADKMEILQRAIKGPVTPKVPASILQYHNDLTVIYSEA